VLVEKTDRLYRNIKDWVTIDDLGIEVHLVKEAVILSQDSRSSEKFMHGIRVLMAKNHIDNLSEEVWTGMRERAEQGHWPAIAHLGYRNNTSTRRIDIDPERGPPQDEPPRTRRRPLLRDRVEDSRIREKTPILCSFDRIRANTGDC
jgi:DNA invertase Pin-like site-specific DNA recombinase